MILRSDFLCQMAPKKCFLVIQQSVSNQSIKIRVNTVGAYKYCVLFVKASLTAEIIFTDRAAGHKSAKENASSYTKSLHVHKFINGPCQ